MFGIHNYRGLAFILDEGYRSGRITADTACAVMAAAMPHTLHYSDDFGDCARGSLYCDKVGMRVHDGDGNAPYLDEFLEKNPIC